MPLSRHSTLPELRSFVSLFRPKRIVPNTLDLRLQRLDWLCIDRMFDGCLRSPTGRQVQNLLPFEVSPLEGDEDVNIKNVVGGGDVADIVLRWADSNHVRRKLEVARGYLKPQERVIVDRVLGASGPVQTPSIPLSDKGKTKTMLDMRYGSDEDTDDDDDDVRGRTAHRLFASLAGIDENQTPWCLSSPPSDNGEQHSPQATPLLPGPSRSTLPLNKKIPSVHPLTPISSPFHPIGRTPSGRIRQLKTPTTAHRSHRLIKKQDLEAGKGLASPICLQSSSPGCTIFSSPTSKSKSKVPERYALKSPLAEQQNGINIASPLTPSIANGSGAQRRRQSESTTLHAVVAQVSTRISPIAGNQQGGLKSLETASRGSASRQTQPRRVRSQFQRIKIGERLAQSRPGHVAPSYAAKRAKLLARCVRLEAKESHAQALAELGVTTAICFMRHEEFGCLRSEPTIPSFDTVDNDDGGMDWNRSRDLADAVRLAITNGQPVSLPPLKCADSQSDEYAF